MDIRIDNLPKEIIFEILKFLHGWEVVKLSIVCKSFYSVSSCWETLWEYFCKRNRVRKYPFTNTWKITFKEFTKRKTFLRKFHLSIYVNKTCEVENHENLRGEVEIEKKEYYIFRYSDNELQFKYQYKVTAQRFLTTKCILKEGILMFGKSETFLPDVMGGNDTVKLYFRYGNLTDRVFGKNYVDNNLTSKGCDGVYGYLSYSGNYLEHGIEFDKR